MMEIRLGLEFFQVNFRNKLHFINSLEPTSKIFPKIGARVQSDIVFHNNVNLETSSTR